VTHHQAHTLVSIGVCLENTDLLPFESSHCLQPVPQPKHMLPYACSTSLAHISNMFLSAHKPKPQKPTCAAGH
jgi:hypothetical protein